MAEDSGQDKSEEPTEKRLRDARKKGQVPRSRELNTFMALITGSAVLIALGGSISSGLLTLMRQQFQLDREAFFNQESPAKFFGQVMLDGILLVMPFGLLLMSIALISPALMGGWNFSSEAMTPKLSKMNPLAGLKRMFGVQGLVELLKSMLKIVLVFFVATTLFGYYYDRFMLLNRMDLNVALLNSADIVLWSFLILSASLLLVVAIDVPFQLWNNKRQLMMTKQEVKDELKEQEGSPEVKGQLRKKQMEMAQQRMMDDVPKADVIVTNPSHFAVALKYDALGNSAPVVVAKGVELVAAQIRNVAIQSDVPLVAIPTLSRALYYSTEIGDEIPQKLFLAVAQVLAYVFQLKTASEQGWAKPNPPKNIKVPEEYTQM